MTSTTHLRKLNGERFGSVGKSMSMDGRWDLIARVTAEEFRVRPDDVSIDEGTGEHDEGLEYLTIDGKRIGFIDEQIGLSPNYAEAIPVYRFAEAAE